MTGKIKYFLAFSASFLVMVHTVPALAEAEEIEHGFLLSIAVALLCLTVMLICLVKGRLWDCNDDYDD